MLGAPLWLTLPPKVKHTIKNYATTTLAPCDVHSVTMPMIAQISHIIRITLLMIFSTKNPIPPINHIKKSLKSLKNG